MKRIYAPTNRVGCEFGLFGSEEEAQKWIDERSKTSYLSTSVFEVKSRVVFDSYEEYENYLQTGEFNE